MRAFEDLRSNPFHLRHMRVCHTMLDLQKIGDPKVVLASASDLQTGFARQLFADWATNEDNAIILTEFGCPGSLTRYLNDHPQVRNHPDIGMQNFGERISGKNKPTWISKASSLIERFRSTDQEPHPRSAPQGTSGRRRTGSVSTPPSSGNCCEASAADVARR